MEITTLDLKYKSIILESKDSRPHRSGHIFHYFVDSHKNDGRKFQSIFV